MKIANKTFIVTGGGSGMGRELTLQLVQKGAHVIIIDLHEDDMNETANMAGQNSVSSYRIDISDKTAIDQFVQDVGTKHPNIDGVVNNAGIIQPFIDVKDLDFQQIEKVMNVNFYGPLYLTKALLPRLLKRPEAHILNVSSMGGFIPFPGQAIYGASKAAVKLLTEALYAELLNTKVGVTLAFPGAIDTNIMSNSGLATKEEEAKSKREAKFNALPADKAAAQMIKAIEKNKLHVLIGKDAKMMNFLYRLAPRRAINMITKQMAKMKAS
ncbi:SDR family NAD(P)-dependent oxidoreductase [Parvicella tangerina]|uniref:Oxidoreductase SadH n=1 Tax=Parvicella tangerina TaxID=2829795 RepID=A0A916JLD9_9FLAO|nr:SDR family oxidoreductase [Parvicella tangerina]CAG5079866.1 Putative oxidoreductase SadH [Parvicella tangerina]